METALVASDKVTLLRPVSEGPMAVLFAGERRAGTETHLVAVKVLRNRRARDAEQLGAMRDLGRRLHRLGHRHIIAATDLGVVEGRPALVSPWVDGIDLLDWVEVLRENETKVPSRVICEILRAAASALDAAQQRVPWGEAEALGLQHRDIKPTNFMIGRDGELKVLDFGTGFTSLAGRDARAGATRAGLARYLSPGRRSGKRGGPPSDVYALGLTGVELFRGRWLRKVHDANPAHDRQFAELVATLPDPGMRSPADDRGLRSLLLRMVAFDPDARPTAVEVAQTFRSLADRTPGPSLESFAHDHALPLLDPPEAQDGMPEARLVEPRDLPSLVDSADPTGEIPIHSAGAGAPPSFARDGAPLLARSGAPVEPDTAASVPPPADDEEAVAASPPALSERRDAPVSPAPARPIWPFLLAATGLGIAGLAAGLALGFVSGLFF